MESSLAVDGVSWRFLVVDTEYLQMNIDVL